MPKVKELTDFADWGNWSKTSKVWNYHMPFHRLNSPPAAAKPDGKGLDCGCRSPRQSPTLLAAKIMESIPNWMPVCKTDNQEREIEGILLRSIHSYTDQPVTQWHHWYDWNFHIQPAPEFEYLMGPANTNPELTQQAQKMGFNQLVIRTWYDSKLKGVMECEWDIGGFGGAHAFTSGGEEHVLPGPMFATDWAWPMTGQYIWLAGRWIYDCGHPQPGDLMHTELHPCKAVATARWEAVQFPENDNRFVPGIQFMFFASRWGGYINFNTIHDKDYEFIVDLPIPAVPAPVEYTIGHTPDFPLNTAVLRWDLLKKFEYGSFTNAVHDPASPGTPNPKPAIDPIVELMEPFDPAKPQAKITIPLKRTELQGLNAYGVIISLGWRDPDRSQAKRVKKCTIVLDDFSNNFVSMKLRNRIPGEFETDMDPGIWRVRIAVNGRWAARNFLLNRHSRFPLGLKLVLHLSEEDGIHFSANGFIERKQGAFMVSKDLDARTLHFTSGGLIDWQRDIVGTKEDTEKTEEVFNALFLKGIQFTNFPGQVDENFPLGFLDPYLNSDENPLRVDRDLAGIPKIVSAPYSLEAANGDLVEKSDLLDHFITYTVTIEPQKV